LRPPNEEVKEHADRPNTILSRTVGTTKDAPSETAARPLASDAVDVGAAIVERYWHGAGSGPGDAAVAASLAA
jgi:hypothetical protein